MSKYGPEWESDFKVGEFVWARHYGDLVRAKLLRKKPSMPHVWFVEKYHKDGKVTTGICTEKMLKKA